jgi:hypothetical protein
VETKLGSSEDLYCFQTRAVVLRLLDLSTSYSFPRSESVIQLTSKMSASLLRTSAARAVLRAPRAGFAATSFVRTKVTLPDLKCTSQCAKRHTLHNSLDLANYYSAQMIMARSNPPSPARSWSSITPSTIKLMSPRTTMPWSKFKKPKPREILLLRSP